MSSNETLCPMCSRPAVLRHDTSRYRRGDRVATVPSSYWECSHGCVGPDGDQPFSFEDRHVAAANDAAARRTWLMRFGEPMPAARRPGRKAKSPRTHRVPVLMSEDELRLLDQARGRTSRGEFLRKAMKQAANDPDGRPTP